MALARSKIFDWLSRNKLLKFIWFKITPRYLRISEEDINPYAKKLKIDSVFKNYYATNLPIDIENSFNSIREVPEFEYLLSINSETILEPYHGWLIRDNRIAIKRSLPYGIAEITPLPHFIYYKKKRWIKFAEGLPLFYNWFNYWHFYNDIIGSLMVLDKLKFNKTIPIIVPEKALNIKYVIDFFSTDYAKKWNWVFVSRQTYVQLKNAYIVKSFANVKDQFLLAADIFKTIGKKKGNRKIFLNRNAKRGRNILNIEEILPVVKSYGFEVVDTDDMSVYEQKSLFESSSVILGIHGAGLTNMFFRYPEKCTILELFPKDKYPIHYYWLARELGFDYDAISGETNENGSFVLDKTKLIEFLSRH